MGYCLPETPIDQNAFRMFRRELILDNPKKKVEQNPVTKV
jgi:hypothetical protein